jgi:hypothetical protein
MLARDSNVVGAVILIGLTKHSTSAMNMLVRART